MEQPMTITKVNKWSLRNVALGIMILVISTELFSIIYLIFFNVLQIQRHAQVYYHYDFGFFYWAFDSVIHQHATSLLYNQPLQQAWMQSLGYPHYAANQYVYPPQFAVLFCWLALFPFYIAADVWTAMSTIAYIAGFFMVSKLAYSGRSTLLWMFMTSIWLADYGYYSDWIVGNASWLIFVLLCLLFYLRYARQRPMLAGIALGLAVVIKITPVILLVYYAARRDWKTVLGALIGVGSATLITAMVLGWHILQYYVGAFSSLAATSMKNGPAPYNSSVKGALTWLSEFQHLGWTSHRIEMMFVVFVIIAVVLTWWSMRGHANDARRESALAGLCVVLFSPLTEGTHMLVLLIPLMMVMCIWWDENVTQLRDHNTSMVTQGPLLPLPHFIFYLVYIIAAVCLTTTGQIIQFVARRAFPLLLFTGFAAITICTFVQLTQRQRVRQR